MGENDNGSGQDDAVSKTPDRLVDTRFDPFARPDGLPKNRVDRLMTFLFSTFLDGPTSWFHDVIVEPLHRKNRTVYYHRRYKRVPPIDECYEHDMACIFEANEQFLRDQRVDMAIVQMLRNKFEECELYYKGSGTAPAKCKGLYEDLYETEANFFCKYGDMGPHPNVRESYMKQKHRMIWERRHGPVGLGRNPDYKPDKYKIIDDE